MLLGTCLCGKAGWTMDALPKAATACSCAACRRYGTLWAYGTLGVDVRFTGDTRGYVRTDIEAHLAFHSCTDCGCVVGWLPLSGEGRCAVNLRLTELGPVADVPMRRFDGAETWASLPDEGRVVGDVWF